MIKHALYFICDVWRAFFPKKKKVASNYATINRIQKAKIKSQRIFLLGKRIRYE